MRLETRLILTLPYPLPYTLPLSFPLPPILRPILILIFILTQTQTLTLYLLHLLCLLHTILPYQPQHYPLNFYQITYIIAPKQLMETQRQIHVKILLKIALEKS